jgi:hypothetical protein
MVLSLGNRQGLQTIKIPNYKHQNTNKSQISISNDRNLQLGCTVVLMEFISTDISTLWLGDIAAFVWNFGIESLEFICDLLFGACIFRCFF